MNLVREFQELVAHVPDLAEPLIVLLAGAIPAAALALLVQGAFELGERRFGWMARARPR